MLEKSKFWCWIYKTNTTQNLSYFNVLEGYDIQKKIL
jgi:hypothetical protein